MKIPESLILKCSYLLVAVVALKLGFFMWSNVNLTDNFTAQIAVLLVYLGSFFSLFIFLYESSTQKLSFLISLLLVCGSFLYLLSTLSNKPQFGTDGILFSRYSVDLILEGKNPYSCSMEPAFEKYGLDLGWSTPTTDGGRVTSLSYPALSVLIYLPFVLLGVSNINLVTFSIFLITVLFIFIQSPSYLRLFALSVLLVDLNLCLFTTGGVFDIIWVFPLLFAMKYWINKPKLSALFMGLAFSVKQTPYIIVPFLIIWILKQSESILIGIKKLLVYFSIAFFVFLLPNLPFIVNDPKSWFSSVMTPIAGSRQLIVFGQGLSSITYHGLVIFPKEFYTLATIGIMVAMLLIYLINFDKVKYWAWISPSFILWFNYRSLQNYFIFFIPVACYTFLCWIKERSDTITGETNWKKS